jgi:hypothetical protein
VGPFAGNYGKPETNAPAFTSIVDYFFNTASPIDPEDATDTDPVEISNIHATKDAFSAQISWTTNKYSTGSIAIGKSTAYENGSVESNAAELTHNVTLTGLTPKTLYHYKITSEDGNGNSANSGNMTFTTNSDQSYIVSDNFTASDLNTEVWTFIDPLNDATLTMTGTQVSIVVPAGTSHDIWKKWNFAPQDYAVCREQRL